MIDMDLHKQDLLEIIFQAGRLVMDFYQKNDLQIRIKHDSTQVTQADELTEKFICKNLQKISPNITIIAEESATDEVTSSHDLDIFWLVDPIDGTKGFINRNGEFSINIALIQDKKPILGLIHEPIKQKTYFGKNTPQIKEAYVLDHKNQQKTTLKFRKPNISNLISLESRFHHPENQSFCLPDSYQIQKRISLGSALKFCELAKGNADFHIRHGQTMEWDTAAGQAILEACGGKIITFELKKLTYQKPRFLNPGFIACHKDFLLG